ncbi:unnamed protein product [Colletotrichum noveboracense]|uniref:HET domain-containing protein n=1 Tax=Colletotrichum noveboracense TaxID=2664923 RepID=A0A9W4S399_9PEZI|nr:unnamed protein product [Colletotrichum noveboracense]
MSIRLIEVKTMQLKLFNSRKAPRYVILSHTWVENEEVSYQEMCQIAEGISHPAKRKSGYRKIWETCRQTMAHGLKYAWVDTCCIDKTSSAELSEAINSMFRWYRDAAVCIAYLSDYTHKDPDFIGDMRDCQWFTRGWCLQELIAPKCLVFYDKTWEKVGSKAGLTLLIARCTGIDAEVLEDHTAMYPIPVARRMSWASRRITTRVEDIAYCLLGIFDIHMPMLYGEGEKAFVRLQEEIIRRFNDTSIFLFSPNASALYSFSPSEAKQKLGQNNTMFNSTMETPNTSDGQYSECPDGNYLKEISTYQLCGMFAGSPADFASSEDIVHASESRVPFDKQAFSVSNRGVQLGKQDLWVKLRKPYFIWYTPLRHSKCPPGGLQDASIVLRKVGRGLFVRSVVPPANWSRSDVILREDVCVLPHITPATHRQIFNTLKTVLRIRIKGYFANATFLSEPSPKAQWDGSGSLFLLTSLASQEGYFSGKVRVVVNKTVDDVVDFHLRFAVLDYSDRDARAFVVFDQLDQKRSLGRGFLSSHSHHSSNGVKVEANIYQEAIPDSMVYTCSLEVNEDRDSDG